MNCYRERWYLGDKSAMSRSSLCVKSSMLVSLVSDMRDSEHADTCRLRSNNWHGVQRSVGDTATHSSSSPRQRVNAPICQSHHSMMHYYHHGVSSVTLLSPCIQHRLLVTDNCQWQPGKMPTNDTPTPEKINMFASTSILPHFQTSMTFTLTLAQLILRYIQCVLLINLYLNTNFSWYRDIGKTFCGRTDGHWRWDWLSSLVLSRLDYGNSTFAGVSSHLVTAAVSDERRRSAHLFLVMVPAHHSAPEAIIVLAYLLTLLGWLGGVDLINNLIMFTVHGYNTASHLSLQQLLVACLLWRGQIKLGQAERLTDSIADVRVKEQSHAADAEVTVSVADAIGRMDLRISPQVSNALNVDDYQLVTWTLKREVTECLQHSSHSAVSMYYITIMKTQNTYNCAVEDRSSCCNGYGLPSLCQNSP